MYNVIYELQLSLLRGWQEPVGEKQLQELKWLKLCDLNRRKMFAQIREMNQMCLV